MNPFSLFLEVQKKEDLVFVVLELLPLESGEPVELDGVALELLGPTEERIGSRLILPISGNLSGPLKTQAELRSPEPIPAGCSVHATAWMTDQSVSTSMPVDPLNELESHMRGSRLVLPEDKDNPKPLTQREIRCLGDVLPWLLSQSDLGESEEDFDGPIDTEESIDELTDELGLDEEEARWLKELLEED